ncbi:MFS transporter [Salinadaptatus halalkaliphilus]|uniref:MFS transporter n=1 Tax=Salinadaptatus halalkaliphilus TaxID=2419781 RepID=A0A4S3TR24_9EURY|nr:MFS transporter [Salinadaptatus halalkaliphilus]THE66862.1 MFS transporter [Salinadaptatus halalkaliphilus]
MAAHGLVHTYELSIPILMTIWLLEFSVTAAVLGAVVTVGYGLFGVGALPGGILVDRYGSRRLIVSCLAGMGLSFLLLSVSPTVVTIALALGVWGIAASVYHPAGLALISNGVQDDVRGTAFAYHGMAGNAGIAFGPLATALLLLVVDWRLVAVALAIPALVAAVVGVLASFDETAALEAEAATQDEPIRSLTAFLGGSRRVFTVGFTIVFVLVMFNGLYYRGILTFLPEMLDEFLTTHLGAIELGFFGPDSPVADEFDLAQYVYVGLLTVGIGGQYLGGKLTDRLPPERGVVACLSALVVIALVYTPAAEAGLAPLGAISVALGFVLFALQPLTQATIAKYSPPDSRGLSFGYTYLGIFGVGSLGATIVGGALTYGTTVTVFLILAGFATIACTLAIVLVARDGF